MKMLKEWLGLIAIIMTVGTAVGGTYVTSRLLSERETMRAEFVPREVWQQESAHQRELLAEVKSTVTETNRTVNEFIRGERHGR
jgi:hypothetical protein